MSLAIHTVRSSLAANLTPRVAIPSSAYCIFNIFASSHHWKILLGIDGDQTFLHLNAKHVNFTCEEPIFSAITSPFLGRGNGGQRFVIGYEGTPERASE